MPTVKPSEPTISAAQTCHLIGAKRLSDRFKNELGFINRGILQKAIDAGELLVAFDPTGDDLEPLVIGLVHFYVRRDEVITLYSIVVDREHQGRGLGRRMFEALVAEAQQRGKTLIKLKCPTELAANLFYEHLGLEIGQVETGKYRPLNVWLYSIPKQAFGSS